MGTYNTLIAFEDEHPDRVAAFAKAVKREGLVGKIGKTDEPGVQPMELSDDVLGDPEGARKTIGKLSRKHKVEIVLILAQSSVDAFLFVHWNSGKMVRALAHGVGEEYVWNEAEGEPQEWEGPAFKDEDVKGADGKKRRLGQVGKKISGPNAGDRGASKVMHYAHCASVFYS